MTLRIGFNAYLLSVPSLRGWTRYTVNLLAALPAHGVRPVLYSLAPIHPDHLARLPPGCFEVRSAPPMRYLWWENRWLPQQLRDDRVDVFHCPMNYGMPWATPCPRVLTLHDAIDELYHAPRLTRRERWRPRAIRPRLANWIARRRADAIITVSHHAKSDIVRGLGVPAAKVSVIHEAADPHFHQPVPDTDIEAMRRTHRLHRPYFFYIGGWEGRKNIPFLLRCFAAATASNVELILAGGREPERSELAAVATTLGIADRVRFLGFVPDAELPALYAGGLAFVYPSEYEGFGLQVCEAMAVGCPVLVARATSLPQIAGSGGETFTLGDPAELSALLGRVATDAVYRASLAARATERSRDFSWDDTAAATSEVYRMMVRSALVSSPL